jgi:hypothetical protein
MTPLWDNSGMATEDNLNGTQFPRGQLRSRWQTGNCGTYARALIQMRPGLRLGALGVRDDPDDPESMSAEHYFAHDDTHAYDSLGKHPLPYTRPGWPVQELDWPDHGVAEEEFDTRDEIDDALYRAQSHALKHRVLGDG